MHGSNHSDYSFIICCNHIFLQIDLLTKVSFFFFEFVKRSEYIYFFNFKFAKEKRKNK